MRERGRDAPAAPGSTRYSRALPRASAVGRAAAVWAGYGFSGWQDARRANVGGCDGRCETYRSSPGNLLRRRFFLRGFLRRGLRLGVRFGSRAFRAARAPLAAAAFCRPLGKEIGGLLGGQFLGRDVAWQGGVDAVAADVISIAALVEHDLAVGMIEAAQRFALSAAARLAWLGEQAHGAVDADRQHVVVGRERAEIVAVLDVG